MTTTSKTTPAARMPRQSKLWLGAAAAVAVVVVVVVVLFGTSAAPAFPSLYEEGAPTIEGSVAYVEYRQEDCVYLLDVATGESEEILCERGLWLEDWDSDGNLRVHRTGPRFEELVVIDPATGEAVFSREFRADEEPPFESSRSAADRNLRSSARDGHATLSYEEAVLIDVEGSRDYSFWEYGVTEDEAYAWVCDSEERLLVVALDGSGGPWIVAEGINELRWK
jgi:hypothetical protein